MGIVCVGLYAYLCGSAIHIAPYTLRLDHTANCVF